MHNGNTIFTTNCNPSEALYAHAILHDSGTIIEEALVSWNDFTSEPFVACVGDDNLNWAEVETFDQNNVLLSSGIEYHDKIGKKVQSQYKNISNGEVMASQSLYDAFGRSVGKTLTAPINSSYFCYKSDFVQNSTGGIYTYNDFNKPNNTNQPNSGEVNNPKPVGDANMGTLGWYYSDNNTFESQVPSSNYPYVRTEYSLSNPGKVRRVAQAGNYLRMGSGHEKETYTVAALGELNFVYGVMLDWNAETAIQGAIPPTGPTNLAADYKVFKKISRDENGAESVSFTDFDGKELASCRSGLSQTEFQNVTTFIPHGKFVDVHLPKYCEASLVIHNNGPAAQSGQTNPVFKILDLSTDKFVNAGATVSHGNSFGLSPGVYRIIHVPTVSDKPYPLEGVMVSTQLNYEHWALNYYDKGKRMVKSIPPLGVDVDYAPWVSMDSYNQSHSMSGNNVPANTLNGTTNSNRLDVTGVTGGVNAEQVIYLSLWADAGTNVVIDQPSVLTSSESLISLQLSDRVGDKIHRNASWDKEFVAAQLPVSKVLENQVQTIKEIVAPYEAPASQPFAMPINSGQNVSVTCAINTYDIEYSFWGVKSNGQSVLLADGLTINARKYYDAGNCSGCNCLDQWAFFYGAGTDPNIHVEINPSEHYTGFYAKIDQISDAYHWPSEQSAPVALSNLSLLSEVTLDFHVDKYHQQTQPDHLMANKNNYNSLNWLLWSETPDAGVIEYNYRKDGKVRFSQNELQRNSTPKRFSFTNYDQFGRPIQSGEYIAEGVSFVNHYFANPTTNHTVGLVDRLWYNDLLNAVNKREVKEIRYDLPDPGFVTETGLSGWEQKNVRGRISYSWNDNLKTWYSHNFDGDVVWMVQKIGSSGPIKTIEYEYNEVGNIQKISYQKGEQDAYYHYYTYDADNRLAKVFSSSTDMGYAQSVANKRAEYKYYMTGSLKQYEIAHDKQDVDYFYTINGWLKSINKPTDIIAGPPSDGDDLFAMALDYFSGDYSRSGIDIQVARHNIPGGTDAPVSRYDGTIRAQHWKRPLETPYGNGDQEAQVYHYDKYNNLTKAIYGKFKPAPSQGFPELVYDDKFKVSGIEYDLNGNITKLNRNGANSGNIAMDALSYIYATNGNGKRTDNKLQYVNDVVSSSVYIADLDDQNTGHYVYDDLGRLVQEKDENGDYIYYTYNHSGKVTEVYHLISGQKKFIVQYGYDDKDLLLKKFNYQNYVFTDTDWYIRDKSGNIVSIYNGTATASPNDQIETMIYGSDRIGLVDQIGQNEIYKYELKDHLGNVRTVIKEDHVEEVRSDFYPFGSRMKSLNGVPEKYRFGYQGEFAEEDGDIGKHRFKLRLYDSRIGRWLSKDPKNEFASPYLAMGNNPILFGDPDGALTDIFIIGKNLSTITIKTDLINTTINASGLGVDFGGHYSFEGKEILMAALDIGGLIDPTPTLDALSASIYLEEGNWFDATISGIGTIAYVGDLAKGPRLYKGLGVISDAISKVFKKAPEEMITVYRGVNNGAGEAYTNALNGIVKPRGGLFGHSNAKLHNSGLNGTINSKFTSWTTDIDVALNYAYRNSGEGVLLELKIPKSRLTISPNTKSINLFHKPGTIISESEWLLKGSMKNISLRKVKF